MPVVYPEDADKNLARIRTELSSLRGLYALELAKYGEPAVALAVITDVIADTMRILLAHTGLNMALPLSETFVAHMAGLLGCAIRDMNTPPPAHRVELRLPD